MCADLNPSPPSQAGHGGVGRCQFAVFGNLGVGVDTAPNTAPNPPSGLLAPACPRCGAHGSVPRAGCARVAAFDVKKKGWSFGHNAQVGERIAPPEWGRVDCDIAHIIDACFPKGIIELGDKRLSRSIFLLRFSALAHPPKEKYSVNKKTRVSLLENLNGWLGAKVQGLGLILIETTSSTHTPRHANPHVYIQPACPACEGRVWKHSGTKCAYRLHFRTVAKQGNLGACPGVYFLSSCIADDSL